MSIASIRWGAAIFLLIVAVTVLFVTRSAPELEGAVTINRLVCEPGQVEGLYTVRVRASNTTSSSLKDAEVMLLAGSGENLAHGTVTVSRWGRGEVIDESVTVDASAELDVCIARFYTARNTPIPAIYRP